MLGKEMKGAAVSWQVSAHPRSVSANEICKVVYTVPNMTSKIQLMEQKKHLKLDLMITSRMTILVSKRLGSPNQTLNTAVVMDNNPDTFPCRIQ